MRTDWRRESYRVTRVRNISDRVAALKLPLPTKPIVNPEAIARTRGRVWMRIRRRQLRDEPLCRVCKERGLVVAADEVDHIIPLERGGTDHPSNLQSLCTPDHRAKTNAENRARLANG
jgi:5-methylcytosine-specific restriction protein A